MSHFQLLLFLAAGLYVAECLLWVGEGGWLILTWYRRFSLGEGPVLRFRNPFPLGHAFRLAPPPLSPPVSLSLKEARNQWRKYRPWASALQGYAQGLLMVAVLAILLFELRHGFWLAWGTLAFFFLFFHLSIAQIFWRAYRCLYPQQKGSRIRKTLLCLVSPWQSSRAADLLGDNLLAGFHPLVATRLLLAPESFSKLARRWLLELRYPPALKNPQSVRPLAGKTAVEEEKRITQWMTQSGLDPALLLKPLEATEPSQKSYCPHCDLPYQLASGECKDCGRPLIPFQNP